MNQVESGQFLEKSGGLHLLLIAFFGVAAAFFSVQANSQPMFSVVRHGFTRGVVAHEPTQLYLDPTAIKSGEALYLWIEISINDSGLRYLKAFGRLPVSVVWGKDGLVAASPVDIGIKTTEWQADREKILWMFRSSGDATFRWRTQALRENLTPGQHYVSVLDPNKKVVSRLGDGVTAFRPGIAITSVSR